MATLQRLQQERIRTLTELLHQQFRAHQAGPQVELPPGDAVTSHLILPVYDPSAYSVEKQDGTKVPIFTVHYADPFIQGLPLLCNGIINDKQFIDIEGFPIESKRKDDGKMYHVLNLEEGIFMLSEPIGTIEMQLGKSKVTRNIIYMQHCPGCSAYLNR